MDLNDFRILAMLIGVAAFAGVVWWAYSPSRRGRFEHIAHDILDEGEINKGSRA